MVHARCSMRGCEFKFDDAEYMDDAIAKMRQHFRNEHHTKGFWENRFVEDTEAYNCTLDEHIERYVGIQDWRADDRHRNHVITACQSLLRHRDHYIPEVVAEAEAVIAELGAQPAPEVAPPANPIQPGAPVFVPPFDPVDVEFEDDPEF